MSDEYDINDVFDTILLSEEKIVKEAFKKGLDKGKKDGEVDGYHAGYHAGAEMGAEIGFYKGVVNVILTNKVVGNEKSEQSLKKLSELLAKFQEIGDSDIGAELNAIRAQYKKLCSIMKLNLPYATMSRSSF